MASSSVASASEADGFGSAAAHAVELDGALLQLMSDDFDVFGLERELEGIMDEDLAELAEILDLPCAGEQEFDRPAEAVQEVVADSAEAGLYDSVLKAAEGEA